MSDLFGLRVERPGIRLQRLELFNWGTFDSSAGEVYVAAPEGRTMLMVGRNGAGKSTLVDAILTLLVPSPIRNYNVAAGARKTERTERTYVLGACDQQIDDEQSNVTKRYLRKGASFYSVVLAHFHDEHADSGFTLAQVLYPKGDGSIDHVHCFAEGNKSIADDLSGLTKTDGIMAVLKAHGFRVTRTFSEYHNWFVRRAGLKPLAMDMFNQTVAVKDIQSLNKFIRDHMLESSGGRERVQKLIEHFAELRSAHRQLVRVKMQHDTLLPVEEFGKQYAEFRTNLSQTESLLSAADPYFRDATVRLAEPELARLRDELAAAENKSSGLRRQIDDANEEVRRIQNEIDNAGGQRLREIPRLIEVQEAELKSKRQRRTEFHDALRRAGHRDEIGTPDRFAAVRSELSIRKDETDDERSEYTSQRDSLIVQRAGLRDRRRKLEEELETLQKRRTNLPGYLSRLRTQICEDIGLQESELVFASELIAVDDDHAEWEPSIEMVLRGFALSLLVPEKLYRQVSQHIDSTRLTDGRNGQRLVYLRVGQRSESSAIRDQLHESSLCHKLRYRSGHPLVPWVTAHIEARFDYRCCDSMQQFREAPRLAVTKNRHVKVGEMRHEKDDRDKTVDPSRFVLGWDNREKKLRLAKAISELDQQIAELDIQIEKTEDKLKAIAEETSAILRSLEVTSYDEIDCEVHEAMIASLVQERKELESNNDQVVLLKGRLAEKQQLASDLIHRRDQVAKQIGGIENEIQRGEKLLATAQAKLKQFRAEGRWEAFERSFDRLTEMLGRPELSFDDLWERESQFKTDREEEIRGLRAAIEPVEADLTRAMGAFLKKCPEEKDDLDSSVDALPSFLIKLESIREEDLPKHEKRFKERLNDTVTKEIGVFHSELQNEGRHIEKKIGELNVALRELPYNDGTHMRLDVRPVKNAEIADFRGSLRSCLDDTFEDTDAAQEARFKRIEELISRLSEESTWRDRVIDVRRWYDFGACEVETDCGATRSYYEDSSGQSGGEKAKLAFTILVAAIAYQYDLDLTGRKPGGFHFVVVDEMFSKIDDRFAEYALQLFERFGLQLVIVAPLDAKARVTEPFVQYYLQILKDEKTYRSQLVTMTAREYHEKVLAKIGEASKQGRSKRSLAK